MSSNPSLTLKTSYEEEKKMNMHCTFDPIRITYTVEVKFNAHTGNEHYSTEEKKKQKIKRIKLKSILSLLFSNHNAVQQF